VLWETRPELTLRELFWMVFAKRRDAWDHTAALRGHLANMFRGEDSAPVHEWRFHPLREVPARDKPKRASCTVQQLTLAFVGL
jgi:hypothetical protein